jgi:hypothetical protein
MGATGQKKFVTFTSISVRATRIAAVCLALGTIASQWPMLAEPQPEAPSEPQAGGVAPTSSLNRRPTQRPAMPPTMREFIGLYSQGSYDELIRRTTALIDAGAFMYDTAFTSDGIVPRPTRPPSARGGFSARGSSATQPGARQSAVVQRLQQGEPSSLPLPPADPRLFYWRGAAAYEIGWLGMAEADLMRARAILMEAGGPVTEEALSAIQKIKTLTPPRVREVRSGGFVVFRVYYMRSDAVTSAIIDMLPTAYQVSRSMFGSDVIETPVYIFDNYQQFYQFYVTRSSRPPGSWVRAAGERGTFYFTLQDATGKVSFDPKDNDLRSTVAHEFNHVLLHRAMGTADRELPKWFTEGLAMVAGAQVVPEDITRNERVVARLFAGNALTDPQILENPTSFRDHTEIGKAVREQGGGQVAPSPYAQAFHMTRYLLRRMKPDQLPQFLNRVRDKRNFPEVFQEEFGMTLPDFYRQWEQDTRQALRM